MTGMEEDQGKAKPPFEVVEPTRPSGGGNRIIWIAIVVVVGLILAYAAGLLR
jgi:hypothetical protein